MTEIALDVELMERNGDGVPRELLTRVAGRQPFPAGELRMSTAAWQQLGTIRARGVFAVLDRKSPAMVELRELGLVTALAGLTPAADSLLRVRSVAKLQFGATADGGGDHTTFTSWYAGWDALVAAERVDEHGASITSIHQTTMSASLGLLGSWMRIGPAWTPGHGDETAEHDADLVQRRVDARPGAEPAVPDDASWVTRRAWAAGEWTRYNVVAPTLSSRMERIRTGDMGWFTPEETSDGRVRLDPVAPFDVMHASVSLWQEAVRQLQ
jgi:hypothetical protein